MSGINSRISKRATRARFRFLNVSIASHCVKPPPSAKISSNCKSTPPVRIFRSRLTALSL